MNHLDDLQAQLLAEGSLSAEEARDLAAHTDACEACAGRVESLRVLCAALDRLPLPVVPPGFTQGVLERVHRQERAAARDRRTALAVCLAALAALVAAAAGGGLWIPTATRVAEQLGEIASALHLGAEVMPGLLGGLRLPVAAACAALALPLLLAVARLASPAGRVPT